MAPESATPGPAIEAGWYLTKLQPTSGIYIPGTIRVDLPLVNFKGWMVVKVGPLQAYVKAEV